MTPRTRASAEPLRVTLARTGSIAVALGAAIAASTGGGLRAWPRAALLALWPALGGHWVEVFHLDVVRPRLGASRPLEVVARLIVWFAGGVLLLAAMDATAVLLGALPTRAAWWIGGAAFVVLELIVHLLMRLAGRASLFDGRG